MLKTNITKRLNSTSATDLLQLHYQTQGRHKFRNHFLHHLPVQVEVEYFIKHPETQSEYPVDAATEDTNSNDAEQCGQQSGIWHL